MSIQCKIETDFVGKPCANVQQWIVTILNADSDPILSLTATIVLSSFALVFRMIELVVDHIHYVASIADTVEVESRNPCAYGLTFSQGHKRVMT